MSKKKQKTKDFPYMFSLAIVIILVILAVGLKKNVTEMGDSITPPVVPEAVESTKEIAPPDTAAAVEENTPAPTELEKEPIPPAQEEEPVAAPEVPVEEPVAEEAQLGGQAVSTSVVIAKQEQEVVDEVLLYVGEKQTAFLEIDNFVFVFPHPEVSGHRQAVLLDNEHEKAFELCVEEKEENNNMYLFLCDPKEEETYDYSFNVWNKKTMGYWINRVAETGYQLDDNIRTKTMDGVGVHEITVNDRGQEVVVDVEEYYRLPILVRDKQGFILREFTLLKNEESEVTKNLEPFRKVIKDMKQKELTFTQVTSKNNKIQGAKFNKLTEQDSEINLVIERVKTLELDRSILTPHNAVGGLFVEYSVENPTEDIHLSGKIDLFVKDDKVWRLIDTQVIKLMGPKEKEAFKKLFEDKMFLKENVELKLVFREKIITTDKLVETIESVCSIDTFKLRNQVSVSSIQKPSWLIKR